MTNDERPMTSADSERTSFLAIAIDSACEEIHRAWRIGATPLFIALSPELYAELRGLQARELVGNAPLLLLDLPVAEDQSLTRSEVIVALSPIADGADAVTF